MTSTYSSNLGIELIGTGDQSGTWGVTNNTNLGTLIEQAISGYQTQAITDGADTVITIPNGTSGVARNMTLELTGVLTAARNLIVPANKKLYFIYNNTTGGYAVTVKVSGQTGISVPNGVKALLVSNGTDVVTAITYLTNLTLANPTLSNGVANGIAYLNASKVLSTSSALNFDANGNVLINTTVSGNKLYVAGGASTPEVTVTFSATAMTINCQSSNIFRTTLTANVTTAPTFSNPSDGQTVNWFLTQDATGSRTMTWPSSFKWAGGAVGVLSTTANSVDLVTATYRSTTGFWYVTLLVGFA